MVPHHQSLRYMTPMGLATCSAIFGRIDEAPAVLLVELNNNFRTSITNAIEDIIASATKCAESKFSFGEIVDHHDISWFEAYEFRIAEYAQYPDPSVMQIDVETEAWRPIDAPTLDSLRPFFAAFRQPPKDSAGV